MDITPAKRDPAGLGEGIIGHTVRDPELLEGACMVTQVHVTFIGQTRLEGFEKIKVKISCSQEGVARVKGHPQVRCIGPFQKSDDRIHPLHLDVFDTELNAVIRCEFSDLDVQLDKLFFDLQILCLELVVQNKGIQAQQITDFDGA